MSSLYVRNQLRTWCRGLFGAVFYDTINLAQDPADQIWSTLEFVSADTEQMTFCDTWEVGIVNVIFFGVAGLGDEALLQQAEQDMANLMAAIDPGKRLVILKSTPPADYERSDGTPGFVVSFTINYVCYSQGA